MKVECFRGNEYFDRTYHILPEIQYYRDGLHIGKGRGIVISFIWWDWYFRICF